MTILTDMAGLSITFFRRKTMQSSRTQWIAGLVLAMLPLTYTWATALEPLPLAITPESGSQLVSGNTFVVRVEAMIPVGRMRAHVSAYGNSQTKYGNSPIEFTLTVPWEKTGPYLVVVDADSYDSQSDTIWSSVYKLNMFAMPGPAETPVGFDRISSLFLKAPVSGQPAETKDIAPRALYADQRARQVKLGAFGTTYASSDPAVATVDGDGKVTPVAPGTAYVEVGYLGVKEFAEVRVDDPATGRVLIHEYTDMVQLSQGGMRRDPTTGLFVQEVGFVNTTEWPIPNPIMFVLDGLPDGVKLENSAGPTDAVVPVGSPSVWAKKVQTREDFLLPGATAKATLQFRNDQNLPITYTLRLFGADFP